MVQPRTRKPSNNSGRKLGVCICLIATIAFFLILSSSDDKKVQPSSKQLRSSTTTKKDKKTKSQSKMEATDINRSEKEEKHSNGIHNDTSTAQMTAATPKEKNSINNEEQEKMIATVINDAKQEIEEAEVDEISKEEEFLLNSIAEVEKALQNSLNSFLHQEKGFTQEEVTDVQKEIIKRLKDKVKHQLEQGADVSTESLEHDLEKIAKGYNNVGPQQQNIKNIEQDINNWRDYLIDKTKNEVDFLGGAIRNTIRDTAQEIEKAVIKEKLGVDTSSQELEDTSLEVRVREAKNAVSETAKKEFGKIDDAVAQIMEKVETRVLDCLDSFLNEEKGLSSSDIQAIKDKVITQLKKEVNIMVTEQIEAIDNHINRAMWDELSEIVEEDRYVINRAKKLGLVSQTIQLKDRDVIEKDIERISKKFDEYIQNAGKTIENGVIRSSLKLVENVERDIFKEKGLDVSEEELKQLAKDETYDISDEV